MWSIGGIRVPDEEHALVGLGLAFTTLSVTAVALRVGTRIFIVRSPGLDDVFIVLAALCTVSVLVTSLLEIRFGMRGGPLEPKYARSLLQATYCAVASYVLTHAFAKLSIAMQYRRMFRNSSAHRLTKWLLVYLSVYGVASTILTLTACVPAQRFWDHTVPGGCQDFLAGQAIVAGFNVLNDIILLLVPIRFLKDLQIAKRPKMALFGIFLCGVVSMVIGLVRLKTIPEQAQGQIYLGNKAGIDLYLWSLLEINLGVICASVPALRPLFTRIAPGVFSSASRTKASSGAHRSRVGSMPLSSFNASKQEHDAGIKVEHTFELHTVNGPSDGGSTGSTDSLVNDSPYLGRAQQHASGQVVP